MRKRQRGISLTETVIVVGMGSFLMILTANMLKQANKLGLSGGRDEAELQLSILVNKIIETGRMSTACQRVAVAAPAGTALQCTIDLDVPAAGNLTTVRFLKANAESSVRFQRLSGTTWSNIAVHGGSAATYLVTNLVLCGETEMTLTPATCPLDNAKMYTRAAALSTDGKKSYFRFQVSADAGARKLQMQSAFYVRGVTGVSDLAYQRETK